MAIDGRDDEKKLFLFCCFWQEFSIFILYWKGTTVWEKREKKISQENKRDMERKESDVVREVAVQKKSLAEDTVEKKNELSSPASKRQAVIRAILKEREDFDELEEISDSVSTWRISKRYKAIHQREARKDTVSVAQIEQYMIIEGASGGKAVVYHQKNKNMGVMTGSLVINLNPESEAEDFLEQFEQNDRFNLKSVFLPIGVVVLEVVEGIDIAWAAKEPAGHKDVERVKIEVISDNIQLW